MKFSKVLILACFIGIPGIAGAQEYYYSDFYFPAYHAETVYRESRQHTVDSFALALKISKIEFTTTYYRKKTSKSYHTHTTGRFDREGRMVEFLRTGDTGRRQEIQESNYRVFDEQGNMVSARYSFYGTVYFRDYKYNDSNKPIKETYYGKRKIYSVVSKSYNDRNLLSSETYSKRNGKVREAYTYSYYPDEKLKQIIHTGRRGKTKRVWDYSCDDAGRNVRNLKDTAQVCTIKSYQPDGIVITTTQSFEAKGTPWKTITYTDSLNRVVRYQYYSGKHMHMKYEKDNLYAGDQIERSNTSYYRNNSKTWDKFVTYDSKGRIISENSNWYGRNNKKKKAYSYAYVYNEQGLITSKTTYLDGRIKTTENYRYEFFRMK